MKILPLTSIILLVFGFDIRAGDLVRLEGPRPLYRSERLSIAFVDPKGQITNVNGIPVATQIPTLRREAEAGDTKSQVLLCKALDEHFPDTTNRVEAYKWAAVASSQGDKEAKSLVRALGLFLSEVERERGRLQAEAFVPTGRKSP